MLTRVKLLVVDGDTNQASKCVLLLLLLLLLNGYKVLKVCWSSSSSSYRVGRNRSFSTPTSSLFKGLPSSFQPFGL